jgi:hypothetical protein
VANGAPWPDGACRPGVARDMTVEKPVKGHRLVYFAPSDDLYLTGAEARGIAAALIRAADMAEGLAGSSSGERPVRETLAAPRTGRRHLVRESGRGLRSFGAGRCSRRTGRRPLLILARSSARSSLSSSSSWSRSRCQASANSLPCPRKLPVEGKSDRTSQPVRTYDWNAT